jgi:hypothetical protein
MNSGIATLVNNVIATGGSIILNLMNVSTKGVVHSFAIDSSIGPLGSRFDITVNYLGSTTSSPVSDFIVGDKYALHFNIIPNVGGGSLEAVAATGSEIDFSTHKIFNSPDTPATGALTNELTGAKLGIVQTIYHNDTSLTVPANWVKLGGTYEVSALNIIYAIWFDNDRIEYWINNTGSVSDISTIATVSLPTTDIASSGAPAVLFVLLGDELVYRVSGTGTKLLYWQFTVPHDYKSGGQIFIDSQKSAAITSLTVTGRIDGVIDATMNEADVNTTANNEWQAKSANFGTNLTAYKGRAIQLRVSVVIPSTASPLVYFKNLNFKYNR